MKPSLAIAYAVKRKGKKMAEGGSVRSGKNRDDNERGVHQKSYSSGNPAHKEESDLGNMVRTQPSFAKEPKTDLGRTYQNRPKQAVRDRIFENREIHPKLHGLAEGGEVGCEHCGMSDHQSEDHQEDMVGEIMMKRAKGYSKGGEVANDDHAFEQEFDEPANYDDLSRRDDLEFSYTGENSGDHMGDEQEDEDREDMVGEIMRSRKKKDRMPRPA